MGLYEVTGAPRVFYGRNVDRMPKLVADGCVPMNAAQLMAKRLEVRNSDDTELKEDWHGNHFDTGDGALYLPNGDVVVAYDAQALRDMNADSNLVRGALDLSGVDLSNVEGVRFTNEQLEGMALERHLTLQEAKGHELWRALARDDKELHHDYVDMVFTDNKEQFGYYTNMGVWKGPTLEVPNMRAWFVGRVDVRSGALGFGLRDKRSHLVGLESEKQEG